MRDAWQKARDSYRCVRATSDADLSLAYSLRHDAYVRDGYLSPQEYGVFSDEYDHLPNSECHVLYSANRAIGSLRLNIFDARRGWTRVPSLEIFGDEIDGTIGRDRIFVEPSRFVLSDTSPCMLRRLVLFQAVVACAINHEAKYVIAAVRRPHMKFYQTLHFELVSNPRNTKKYPGVDFYVNLLVFDVNKHRRDLERHPLYCLLFEAARRE